VDIARLRDEFAVLRRHAYLNAGSDGPVPSAALIAARAELERQASDGRFIAHFERRGELTTALRAAYAGLLGCEPADVALTTSTTEGISIAVAGLQLKPGDEIITSDEEHPGMLGPLQAAHEIGGATVRIVPLEAVADAVGPATRLVACSHVSWVTGSVAPAALAGLDVPVLLDGAQGAGAVPVDVRALGCTFYAGSGQKWLCGPLGLGMLWIDPAWQDRVAVRGPTFVNLASPMDGLALALQPDARRHDAPAVDPERLAAGLAAHDVLASAGWDAVHARAAELAGRLAEALAASGREVQPRSATTLVTWRHEDPEAERDRLAALGIAVRDIPRRPWLRASVGAWNDKGDLERLLGAL
jgi:selenocysteine lyase/cysteine desulfurase